MRMGPALRLCAAVGALGVGHAALATPSTWQFTKNQPGSNYSTNNAGGTIESIVSTFDAATKRLTFDVAFSGAGGPTPLVTQGFWLVLNNGPDPKGTTGELAIFYFDATRVFSGQASKPTLTVYEYNGRNAGDSWCNGDGDTASSEPNDFNGLIKGRNEAPSYITDIFAGDQTVGGQTRRRMSFDINASDIVGRSPAYPSAGTSWFGAGFGAKAGIWLHTLSGINTAYDVAGRGGLTAFSITAAEGWLDGNNFTVPAPAPAGLLGAGLLAASRRRRVA